MGAYSKHIINNILFPPTAALPPDAMLKTTYDADLNGIVDEAESVEEMVAVYTVTSQFVPNEIFNLRNGSGNMSGLSTPSGEFASILIGNNLTAFLETKYKILLNGLEITKQSEITYISSTSFRLNTYVDAGDVIKIIGTII